MRDTMVHRGPDDAGIWSDASRQVGLGHRRLSIIDTSPAGHQPMANADQTLWIVYNGEIYNFQEHREDLMARGYHFRGHSDTEVLLYLYQEYGRAFLEKLNGIFALAIWDSRSSELLLARDHAGIKPLYYWRDGPRLFFASEIKALLRNEEIPREINREAIPIYLSLLAVPGEETMFKGIRKLEPGCCLVWKDGGIETQQWFNLRYEPEEGVSESEWVDRVRHTFLRTTERQMVSDVPLGAFLSGGLDSSSIVAAMRRTFPDRPITCYTMAYDPKDLKREGIEDDFPHAQAVARHLDVNLKSRIIRPDIVNLLPKIVYHMDEPDAGPTSLVTYFVCNLAKEDGTTVLLSGTGGDEVFFGYSSHLAYRLFERLDWIPRLLARPLLSACSALSSAWQGEHRPLSRRLRRFSRGFLASGLDRHMAVVDRTDPSARGWLLADRGSSQVGAENPIPACMRAYYDGFDGRGELNRHSHVLIQTFLASHNFLFNDKCSMAASIEARVPFMDVELMQLCAAIPERYKLKGKTTKSVLKEAMKPFLPANIIHRPKAGFAPPLREWVISGLENVINDTLSPERIKARGLFDPEAVAKIIDLNKRSQADHGYLIYALLNLELWQQTFIDRPGVEIFF
jgi:asparagine synthase (glutamine-hydrolysing)